MDTKVYYVENTVRREGTRLHRAKSATRHRFKVFVAGQRVLRSKKVALNESLFAQEKKNLLDMCLAGMVAIYTPDGIKVTTAHTGEFILTKPNGAVKVLAQGEMPSCFGGTAVPTPSKDVKMEVVKEVITSASEEEEVDDLTSLPGIGAGRARKLEAAGIDSFAAVVGLGVEGLMEVLGVTEEMAQEVIDAAKE
jgi:hypothetical protein